MGPSWEKRGGKRKVVVPVRKCWMFLFFSVSEHHSYLELEVFRGLWALLVQTDSNPCALSCLVWAVPGFHKRFFLTLPPSFASSIPVS